MRAKMQVTSVVTFTPDVGPDAGKVTQEVVKFMAVGKSTAYPADGSDEDNTFAKWTPSADAAFTILNPALFGQHKVGDKFYVDFTPVSA